MKTNPQLDALRLRSAIITRASQLARRQVKEELRACGERPEHYTCAALTRLAEDRVQAHLRQATAEVTQWLSERP
jgi:hypothetical protein